MFSRSDKEITTVSDPSKSSVSSWFVVGIVLVVVPVVIFAILFVARNSDNPMWKTDDIAVPENLSVSYETDDDGDYVSFYTNKNAEKRVDIFVDPRCPACGELENDIKDEMTSAIQDGTVMLNIHYMTFLDGMTNSDYSKQAAAMEIEIANTGNAAAAWKFHQAMWENQPGEGVTASALPTSEDWAILAEDLGVESTSITRIREGKLDFIDQATQADAANTNLLKEKAGKVSTPTVYVDLNVLENPFYLIDEL